MTEYVNCVNVAYVILTRISKFYICTQSQQTRHNNDKCYNNGLFDLAAS